MTRIDLPGRQWKANRGKTADIDQRIPCFVAGPENRLLVVAMESLMHATVVFNPLILLGPTGCGKSHLAGGIANLWHTLLDGQIPQTSTSQTDHTVQRTALPLISRQLSLHDLLKPQLNPQLGDCESRHVVYLSSSEFGRLYQQVREQDKLAELRMAMARLRMLVLEDLHQMRLSRVIQQELRLAMDKLLTRGGMVLATSQQPLAMITSLEGSLRDRLSAGLTVRIKPPGTAARLELLQLAADRRGTELDLKNARRLSQQVEESAPKLFQALAQLEQQRAQSSLKPVNFSNPISTFPKLSEGPQHQLVPPQKPVTMRQIIAVVARYFSVSQTQLRGNSRRRAIVHARGVTVYLTRILTDLSYAKIGNHLGNRDHTTTMHAYRKLQQLFVTDSLTQECIDDLKRILTASD